jgi:hypothetical protein
LQDDYDLGVFVIVLIHVCNRSVPLSAVVFVCFRLCRRGQLIPCCCKKRKLLLIYSTNTSRTLLRGSRCSSRPSAWLPQWSRPQNENKHKERSRQKKAEYFIEGMIRDRVWCERTKKEPENCARRGSRDANNKQATRQPSCCNTRRVESSCQRGQSNFVV